MTSSANTGQINNPLHQVTRTLQSGPLDSFGNVNDTDLHRFWIFNSVFTHFTAFPPVVHTTPK